MSITEGKILIPIKLCDTCHHRQTIHQYGGDGITEHCLIPDCPCVLFSSEDWVVRAVRTRGYSVIEVTDKWSAERLAEEFNAMYDTDRYYAQKAQEKDYYG